MKQPLSRKGKEAKTQDLILLTLIEAIEKQTAVLEGLAESIGKNTAKWLIKADLQKNNRELQHVALLDMGFQPVEVVDMLYPNLGKSERRAKAKRVALQLSQRRKAKSDKAVTPLAEVLTSALKASVPERHCVPEQALTQHTEQVQ